MISGGRVRSWAWLESGGLFLTGASLPLCLVIRLKGIRRLRASVGEGRSGGLQMGTILQLEDGGSLKAKTATGEQLVVHDIICGIQSSLTLNRE